MNRAQTGFTLVEALVALAILGMSLTVLYKIISDDLDRSRRTRDETVAASLAQSVLAEAEMQARPTDSRGTFAGGYAWHVDVSPYGGARAAWPVDAVTVSATVSWRDGTTTHSRTLTALRVIPKAAP